jgi:hypothetical protein
MYLKRRVFLCACLIVLSLAAVALQSVSEESCETCLSPNPVADLAGLLVPSLEVLYVMPDHVEGVLEALGAVAIADNTYRAEVDCWAVIEFSSELVDCSPLCRETGVVVSSTDFSGDLTDLSIPCLGSLFAVFNGIEGVVTWPDGGWKVGDSVQVRIDCSYAIDFSLEVVDYPAVVLNVNPDIILSDETTRVYKDADCKKAGAAWRTGCQHDKKWGPEYENYVVEFKAINKCVKGHGYCVERKVIHHVHHYYYDGGCVQEYDSKNIMGWSCMP